ncbi:MAG: hypothetical protein ACT4SY_13490 [Hyphomicrobiales bacterium]
MLMRAVFASAMLIGLAGIAQAETRIIYPPYSYEPPMKLCDYILGGTYGCGCGQGFRYGYRHGHHHHDYMMGSTNDIRVIKAGSTTTLVLAQ